jgi:hypothetical protein
VKVLQKYGPAIGYVILAVTLALAIQTIQNNTVGKIYDNQIEACERGNLIREVVYRNTKDAVKQDPGAGFERQLRILQSVPGTDLTDGTLDCRAVITAP